MGVFKTTLITCRQCNKRIMVREADVMRGQIICSHIGCGAVNVLNMGHYYDESVAFGLSNVGYLTYLENPNLRYGLRYGINVIGTSDTCTVKVERFLHNGRCFISRAHCTLTVTFDKWSGLFRYQLQDGVVALESSERKNSLNGTQLNGVSLHSMDIIDVNEEDIINLGGVDRFRLTQHYVDPALLETYKVPLVFNPDHTQ